MCTCHQETHSCASATGRLNLSETTQAILVDSSVQEGHGKVAHEKSGPCGSPMGSLPRPARRRLLGSDLQSSTQLHVY